MAVNFNISHTSTVPLIKKYPYLINYAVSTAMNDAAFEARKALGQHARRVFKNPVKLTLNPAEVILKANPKELKVRLGLRDQVAKGTAPEKYLYAQTYGGPRGYKRVENVLIRANLMNRGDYMIPITENLRELNDGHGQMKGSRVAQMLSHLQAFGEQGYKANIKQPRRSMYFSIKDKGQLGVLSPGIYRWLDKQNDLFEIVAVFVSKRPMYSRRFYYFQVVEKTIKKGFGPTFSRRFQAMAKKHHRKFNLTSRSYQKTSVMPIPS